MMINSIKYPRLTAIFFITFMLAVPQSAHAWISYGVEKDDFGDTVVTSFVMYDYASQSSIFTQEDYDAFFENLTEDNTASWARLDLRCKANNLEIFLTSRLWNGNEVALNSFKSQKTIKYRTNSSTPSNWQVSRSTNKKGLFLGNTKSLISKIGKSKTLSVQYFLSNGNVESATFDVQNLREERSSFAEAGCKI